MFFCSLHNVLSIFQRLVALFLSDLFLEKKLENFSVFRRHNKSHFLCKICFWYNDIFSHFSEHHLFNMFYVKYFESDDWTISLVWFFNDTWTQIPGHDEQCVYGMKREERRKINTKNSGLPKLLRWSHALRSDQKAATELYQAQAKLG